MRACETRARGYFATRCRRTRTCSCSPAGIRASQERRRSAERGGDLVELREAMLALLREDHLAVGDDVELRACTGDSFRFVTVVCELRREAHGPRVVAASDGA